MSLIKISEITASLCFTSEERLTVGEDGKVTNLSVYKQKSLLLSNANPVSTAPFRAVFAHPLAQRFRPLLDTPLSRQV